MMAGCVGEVEVGSVVILSAALFLSLHSRCFAFLRVCALTSLLSCSISGSNTVSLIIFVPINSTVPLTFTRSNSLMSARSCHVSSRASWSCLILALSVGEERWRGEKERGCFVGVLLGGGVGVMGGRSCWVVVV